MKLNLERMAAEYKAAPANQARQQIYIRNRALFHKDLEREVRKIKFWKWIKRLFLQG